MFRAALLVPILVLAAAARPASTVLTLQTDPIPGYPGKSYCVLDVVVSGPNITTSTTTTTLSGTVTGTFDVESGETSEMTLSNGVIAATDFGTTGTIVNLNALVNGSPYTVNAVNLAGTFETINPPGTVDAPTGDFDASQHRFSINQGTASGSGLGQTSVETFTPQAPFEGVGSGLGYVTLTPSGSTAVVDNYAVVVVVPGITVTDTITVGTFITTTVNVTATGEIKAVGTLEVPKSDYLAWTVAQGIPGADGQADANGDGVPNAIAWAMGLGAMDPAQNHLLRPANGGFQLQLPPGGTVAPITIEGSDLSSAFTPLLPGRISTGANPLPNGSSGLITLGRVAGEFVRLSVAE